jgi:hypothetical protein
VSLNVGSWGLEKIKSGLQFITWEPGLGYGYMAYNVDKKGEAEEMGSLSQVDIFNFGLKFPQDKEMSLSLLSYTNINAGKNKERNYWSIGAEAPLFYNFFNKLRPLNFGFHYYFPQPGGKEKDPDFGKDLSYSFFLNYAFIF